MAAVDLKAWQETYTAKLDSLKDSVTSFIDIDAVYLAELGGDKKSLDFFADGIFSSSDILGEFEDTYRNKINISLESIDEVSNTLNNISYIKPAKLAELVDPTITRYSSHVFSDSRLDNFEKQCIDTIAAITDLSAFSYNDESFEDAVQSSLYDYELEMEEIEVRQDIEEIANKWAGSGYTQVPGAMSYDINLRLAEFDKQRTARTRDIFKGLANVIQQNLQWAFENGISIEKLHMDFANRYSELSKAIIGSSVDAYITEIEKRVKDLKAQLVYTDFFTQAKDLNLQRETKEQELQLKEATARLAAYVSNVNTFIQTQSSIVLKQIEIGKNVADSYGSLFHANASSFTGIVDETQTLE